MMFWAEITALFVSAAVPQQAPHAAGVPAQEQALLQQVDQSGRCVTVGRSPEQRLQKRPMIAPGQPPVLSFKLYEDSKHHRFGNVDVMLDDAGH